VSQQINLFSPIFLRPRVYFSARAMMETLLLIATGIGMLYLYLLVQTRGLEGQVADGDRMLHAERARLADTLSRHGSRAPSDLLGQEIARLETSLAERKAILALLSRSEEGKGFSDYLAAFSRRTSRGIWLTGIEIADGGERLSLGGRALTSENIPPYIAQLNREPLLRGREFSAMQVSTVDTGGQNTSTGRHIEFRLEAKPAPENKP
jgi:Fimbrial assembly protein (PilN)